jgi:hypothetical protein
MFTIGIGISNGASAAKYLARDLFWEWAVARLAESETAKVAFAPKAE